MSAPLFNIISERIDAICSFENAQEYGRKHEQDIVDDTGEIQAMQKEFREQLVGAIKSSQLLRFSGHLSRGMYLNGLKNAVENVTASGEELEPEVLEMIRELLETGTCDVLKPIYDERMKGKGKNRQQSAGVPKADGTTMIGAASSCPSEPGQGSTGVRLPSNHVSQGTGKDARLATDTAGSRTTAQDNTSMLYQGRVATEQAHLSGASATGLQETSETELQRLAELMEQMLFGNN